MTNACSTARTLFLLAAIIGIAACDSTPPVRFGALRHRIIEGETQTIVAGGLPGQTVDLSYRERLAVANPRPWQRWVLPQYAYAQSSTTIRVQPGAVVCVSEDQKDLIPRFRCVTADTLGRARFEWIAVPTSATSYEARIGSTYGIESTILATARVNVVAGPVDTKGVWGTIYRSGQSLGPITDRYRNAIPFRIVSDGRIRIADTVFGSAGSIQFFFDSTLVDTIAGNYPVWHGPLRLVDARDSLLARAWYGIRMWEGAPLSQWIVCGLAWTPRCF